MTGALGEEGALVGAYGLVDREAPAEVCQMDLSATAADRRWPSADDDALQAAKPPSELFSRTFGRWSPGRTVLLPGFGW